MSLAPPEFSDSPLAGIDFSWVAIDAMGHVAWLVTFGSAVVPPWIQAASSSFAFVEDLMGALPSRGHAISAGAEIQKQWRDAAERGLFAFDWDVYRGPYRRLAWPSAPAHVDELPVSLGSLARLTRFAHLRFADVATLRVDDVIAARPQADE